MFRYSLSPKLVLILAAFLAFAGWAIAQDGPVPMQERRQPNDERPDLLRQLGLSPEQVQTFMQLNRTHRPILNEAQKRMREANRELDMAIYADDVSDEVVYAKVRAFQAAQAEVNLLRFRHELAIRKLLTHEQLVRFREMRRRFAEARQNQRDNAGPRRDVAPLRRRNAQPRTIDNTKRPGN